MEIMASATAKALAAFWMAGMSLLKEGRAPEDDTLQVTVGPFEMHGTVKNPVLLI